MTKNVSNLDFERGQREAKAAGLQPGVTHSFPVANYLTDEYAWSNTDVGKVIAREVNRRAKRRKRQTLDQS